MPTIPIVIPKIGESVSEATIAAWLKQEGDHINKDEIFVEISTDKVSSELPAEYEGKLLKILVDKNEVAKIGQPIAEMEISEEDYQHYSKQTKITVSEDEVLHEVDYDDEVDNQLHEEIKNNSQYLSPVIKKMALEEGLSLQELNSIIPTGYNARLTKKDVLAYLQQKEKETHPTSEDELQLNIKEKDQVRPLIGIRKKAAKVLEKSYREIPHVTTIVEIDVTKMVEMRNQLKKNYFEEYNLKLTYTHFCFYATVLALKKFPQLNSWYYKEDWIIKKDINFGFATSLPDDVLIVPNIQEAGRLNFLQLVEKINDLAKKAKNNTLEPSDFKDPTFTISNTGIFGSLMGTPIITMPQVAVLALGAIREFNQLNKEGKLIHSKKMYASLSYDHRVINGALASKFLMEISRQLADLKFVG